MQLPEVCAATVMSKVRPRLRYPGAFHMHFLKHHQLNHCLFNASNFFTAPSTASAFLEAWQLRAPTPWTCLSRLSRLSPCFPPSGDRSRRFTLRPSLRNRERRVQASTAVTSEPGDLCGICATLFFHPSLPLNIFQMQRSTSEAPVGHVKS